MPPFDHFTGVNMEALDILDAENLVDVFGSERDGHLKHGKFLYKGEILEVISYHAACAVKCDLAAKRGDCFPHSLNYCPTSFGFIFSRVS